MVPSTHVLDPRSAQEMRSLAQTYALDAIKVLVDLLVHSDPGYRLSAANSLLDRGFGKPAQMQEVTVNRVTKLELDINKLTNDDLNGLIESAARARVALNGGTNSKKGESTSGSNSVH